jgi:hypothetical protein
VLKNRERWLELAELAANEQDPIKLMALVSEINQLLTEKQKRLDSLQPQTLPNENPGKAPE